ncbi:hypothetical protein ABZW11_37585 [Nonomuraea sp. NPDC004580]|uniref:hypothetical protein n=1 Tax=Nonomuraea sp. NPDC004580 TaxID=3154552 RepID=UPI0033AC9A87
MNIGQIELSSAILAAKGVVHPAWVAAGTTAVIYYLGLVAEKWLKGFSWAGLAAALVFGVATTLYLRRRAASAFDEGDL